jgi:hypothetical protein
MGSKLAPEGGRQQVGDRIFDGVCLGALGALKCTLYDLAVLFVSDGERKLPLAHGADEYVQQFLLQSNLLFKLA